MQHRQFVFIRGENKEKVLRFQAIYLLFSDKQDEMAQNSGIHLTPKKQ